MRRLTGLLSMVLMLSGCVVSDNPFPESKKAPAENAALVGRWNEWKPGKENRDKVEVIENAGRLQVSVTSGGAPLGPSTTVYDADVYREGAETFVALKNRKSGAYLLFKYQIVGIELQLFSHTPAAFRQAVSSGSITTRMEEEDAEIVTSPPDQVLAFFAGRPESDLEIHSRYWRSESGL